MRLALAGRYGSRWQLDRRRSQVLISSTVPVWQHNELVGAVSAIKPTTRVVHFVVHTLKELILPILAATMLAATLAYGLSAYLTGIVRLLALRAERIASGESGVRLEIWTRSELGMLARAVERMRRKLEGKAYVEETVTNLSHELKAPLAAIRGAAELLEDGAVNDPVACARFLTNIQQETARLDGIVDGLLQLARLETRQTLTFPFQRWTLPWLFAKSSRVPTSSAPPLWGCNLPGTSQTSLYVVAFLENIFARS